jgi:hypothetical protein
MAVDDLSFNRCAVFSKKRKQTLPHYLVDPALEIVQS